MGNEPSYMIVGTVAWRRIYYIIFSYISYTNLRLTRYGKLRVVYVPGCRKRFPCHWFKRKPPVSDPDIQHGTCVTHVPWCISGSLTRGGVENVPGILGACTTRNFTYLTKGPCSVRSKGTLRREFACLKLQILFKTMHLKISLAKYRQLCPGLKFAKVYRRMHMQCTVDRHTDNQTTERTEHRFWICDGCDTVKQTGNYHVPRYNFVQLT